MRVDMIDLDDAAHATGVVVVVDVLRAFTTAAVAIGRGAREIWPVATVEEARRLRDATPGALAMGEVGGRPVEGFDLSNSPSEMAHADVAGRIVVQRTSAGTQGLVRTVNASRRFAASFACAGATARAVGALGPEAVTFVITGRDERDGDEDLACAEYLAALLRGRHPDPDPYTARVAASSAGRLFADAGQPDFPSADLALAQRVDIVDLCLPVSQANGRLRLRGAQATSASPPVGT
jgi:2-phosphosulfolactate phosphatase